MLYYKILCQQLECKNYSTDRRTRKNQYPELTEGKLRELKKYIIESLVDEENVILLTLALIRDGIMDEEEIKELLESDI